MKILFKICLISILCGCGKPTENTKNNYSTKNFYSDSENKITLIEINSISSNRGDIEFTNTKTLLKSRALKRLKSNNFYHSLESFQALPMVTFKISSDKRSEVIKIKLESMHKLCSIDLKIEKQDNYLEKSINRDELIGNEFYTDIDTNEEIKIILIDYKFCESKQTFREKLTQLKKSNYLVHFEKDNKQHIIAFKHEALLGESLQIIDQNLQVHHDQKIIKFLGKKNKRRISPLNDHLDGDSFWLFLGIDNESLNQNIPNGKVINLFHFTMSEIRSNITQNISLDVENNQVSLARYRDFRIKNLKVNVTKKQYNHLSDDHRVKCKLKGFGWAKCKLKEFKIQLKQANSKINTFENAQKSFNLQFDDKFNIELIPSTIDYFVGLSCGEICGALKFYINPYTGAKQLTDPPPKRFETEKLEQISFQIEAMIL